MDNEKTFFEEESFVKGNYVKSVVSEINKRFHGYYAEDEVEAIKIFSNLVELLILVATKLLLVS